MELRQLLAFKEVVEREGFTRAASHLHLTQSAVSQQIKALEEELGTVLLHRVCRRIRLTDAGHLFLEHVKRILQQVEYAQAEVAEVVSGVKGSCRIACIPSLAPGILPKLIIQSREAYPHVELYTRVGLEAQLLSWLKDGTIDICITGLPLMSTASFETKPIIKEKFVLVVPENHHFAIRKSVKLEELSSEDIVSFPADSPLRFWFSEVCRGVGFDPNVIFESSDLTTRLGMVAANLGVTVESSRLVSYGRFSGTAIVDIEEPQLYRDIGVLWRQSDHMSRHVKNLLALLEGIVQQEIGDAADKTNFINPEVIGIVDDSYATSVAVG